jgi:hypothetical protein
MPSLRPIVATLSLTFCAAAALVLAQAGLTADAGPDRADVFVGSVVTLDGSGSTGETSYAWAFTSRPTGSQSVLAAPSTATPSFTPDRNGTYVIRLTVGDGTTTATDTVSITTLNRAPTANAGPDLALVVGKTAVLDGTASSDPDGDKLTYQWTIVSAPPASLRALSNATKSKAKLIIDRPGTYVAELVVRDGHLSSAADQKVITTLNTRPVANAGLDRVVPLAVATQLDGTASSDVDEQPLSYAWKLKRPTGSAAVLSNPTSARPTFVPDVAGNYVGTLEVSDGTLKKTDTVAITTNGNIAPIARAGRDHPTLLAGQTIVLDASDSTDANGHALTYAWTISKRPGASTATLDSPNSVRSTFTADVKGKYTFTLLVTDSLGASSTDQIQYLKALPVADAGADRAVSVGSTTTLDGSGSSHLGGVLAYGWALVSVPVGSTASIANPADPQPQLVADVAGTYVAQLIVFDGVVLSPADTVVVTAGDNASPRVDLGPDQVVPVSTVVTLDGFAATDPDGGALTLSWALLARPSSSSASLSSSSGGSTQLATDVAGDYVVQLIAADGGSLSAADTVVITTTQGRPTVSAGPDVTGEPLDAITLGAAATDPDGDAVSFDWRFLRLPAGSDSAFDSASSATPTFTPDVTGVYVAQVIASDTDGFEAIDAVVIRVVAPAEGTVVTIAATDSTASEVGPDPGTFTFTRTGDVSLALNGVTYTRTGTATAGTDFTPSLPASGTVNFAAGEATTTVTITPVSDALAEGPETVVLTVTDAAAYDLGAPGTEKATVLITEPDSAGGLINGASNTGAISSAGEVDTWTFTASAGDRMAVHIGEMVDQNDFRPWIRLIAPSGATLGNAAGTDAAVIDDVVAPATGTYLVLVASFDSGFDGTGTYRLTMTHTPGPITVSPGDQGGPLTNGEMHTGEILQGDVDVWTFTATAGQRIAVHIGEITDTDDFRPWIRLWSPTGVSLGDTAFVEADVIDDVVAPVSGTYLVLVASFDPGFDGTGTYRLTMTHTPGPITVSPGDQGGPLTNGAIHTGEILQGDVDVWTFTATAGQRIAVHIGEITDADDFRPWIRLWSPTGVSLGDTAFVEADVIDDVVAPVTGQYLVLVASFDPGFDGTGTYRLTMTHTPGPITVSPGDQGGPLTIGAIHTGEILQGDVDVWTFTATAGEHIDINVGETSETDDFRPWIRLWSPTGASLGDTAGVTAAQILATANATGTYLVLVGSFDSGFDGTGTYSLTLNVTP